MGTPRVVTASRRPDISPIILFLFSSSIILRYNRSVCNVFAYAKLKYINKQSRGDKILYVYFCNVFYFSSSFIYQNLNQIFINTIYRIYINIIIFPRDLSIWFALYCYIKPGAKWVPGRRVVHDESHIASIHLVGALYRHRRLACCRTFSHFTT